MAASTITRDTWVNDTGTAANPNLDGTLLNNSVLQNHVYARIDAMFAGGGVYATLTFGGLIAAEGFGVHQYSAGGTGQNAILVRNTVAGTGNFANFQIGNDATTNATTLYAFSTTYTTSGAQIQDSTLLDATRVGGLNFRASHTSGIIRFFTSLTERMQIDTVGLSAQLQDGSVGTPALRFGNDTDTGLFRSGADAIKIALGGADGCTFTKTATSLTISVPTLALGTTQAGPNVSIGRNNSGSGAAGTIFFQGRDGVNGGWLWMDASASPGVVRVKSTAPVEDGGSASDTSGTVVGTQTSARALKNILGTFTPADDREALALLSTTPIYRFQYKQMWRDQEFVGITTDDRPEFGYDRTSEYPQGQAFNPVSAFGYTVAALKALLRRVEDLEQGTLG